MTYQELLKNCTEELQAVGVPDPESDARLLLEESAGKDYSHLLIDMREQVPEIVLEKLSGFIAMRKKRIPLQQIIGYTEFMGLKFYVNSDVLCPRQDTEVLVEQVLKRITEGAKILDLCTGSGCIAISIAKLAGASVTATDISEKALAVAERNARENGVCVHFYKGDLYQALPSDEKYDIIVSNPPYIRTDVIETLETEVKDYEPRIALDGTADGLSFYRRIIAGAGEHLKPNGLIFFEVGYDQGAEVSALLLDNGFSDISVIKDYGGNDRVVTATLKR